MSRNAARDRQTRITMRQRDRLVEFMALRHNAVLQRHNSVPSVQSSPVDLQVRHKEWYLLGTELNRLGMPKTAEGWSTCWRNLKAKTKQKYATFSIADHPDLFCAADEMIMTIIKGQKVSIMPKEKQCDKFTQVVEALIADDCNIEKTSLECTGNFVHADALIDDIKSEPVLDPLASSSTAAAAIVTTTAEPTPISPDKSRRRLDTMQAQLMHSFEKQPSFDRQRCELLKDRNALLRTIHHRNETYRTEVSAHCRTIEAHNREMRDLKRRKLEFLRSKLKRTNGESA